MLNISEQLRDIIVNYIRGSMSTTHTIAEAANLVTALCNLPVQKEKENAPAKKKQKRKDK